jgi:hypothetical protein
MEEAPDAVPLHLWHADLSPRTGGSGGWGRGQKCELNLLHLDTPSQYLESLYPPFVTHCLGIVLILHTCLIAVVANLQGR